MLGININMPDVLSVPKPRNTVFMHYSPRHAEILGYFVYWCLVNRHSIGHLKWHKGTQQIESISFKRWDAKC